MLKAMVRKAARRCGYDILKVPRPQPIRPGIAPPTVEPLWPLPRDGAAISDDALRERFAGHPFWHYAYAFEGGLSFSTSHANPGPDTDNPLRPLQRFRHFMPYVVQACGGSLQGKRVLDTACNSGFWSVQCALMGAEVVGFDAREEVVAQANLLKQATGASSAQFRVLDFQDVAPELLGGTFDVVLNLGLLYHLPDPVRALELTRRMATGHILLDTAIYPSDDFLVHLKWEEPRDIRMAAAEGVVALPSKPSLELMFRHIRVVKAFEIPVRTGDLPDTYLTGRRASWLLQV